MNKVVGYARVSTKEQSLERQLKELRQYVPEDMIVTDKASGKDLNRQGYQSLKHGIGKLVNGDTLYIKSLDRLSRNKEQAKNELKYFCDIGVRVKVLDLPTTMIDIPDEQNQKWVLNMVNNILIEVLASIAEQERLTIKERQRQGYDALKTDEQGRKISNRTGKVVGRPKAEYPQNWESVYNRWANKEITAKKAMELLNLKRNTFYKLLAEWKEKTE